MCFFCQTKCNFDELMSTNSEVFIKEIREHRLYIFQLWCLSIENIRIFDTVGCRFTHTDQFSFGEEYCDEIYTGNAQFAVENALLTFEEREVLFGKRINIRDHFFRRPTHKSCFTSLEKLKYDFFCTQCKNLYYKFFEKELHVFRLK